GSRAGWARLANSDRSWPAGWRRTRATGWLTPVPAGSPLWSSTPTCSPRGSEPADRTARVSQKSSRGHPLRRASVPPRTARSFWAWVRPLGGVAILAFLLWRLGTSAFLDGLRLISAGSLAAALGIGLLTTICTAWRWRLVATGLGVGLPLGAAIARCYR